MTNYISLDKLNQKEALRYLGYGDQEPDSTVQELLTECEETLLKIAKPRFAYRIFEINQKSEGIELQNTNLILPGVSIKDHLEDCEKAVLMGVTISMEVDKLLRVTQVHDMAKAVILDSLASVAVEQICDKVEQLIRNELPEYNQTWRFGVGYGDLPLDIQGDFLEVINAKKLIGLHVSNSNMLVPTKSVTAVIGLSTKEIKSTKKGCQSCNLKGNCIYRKKGGHCNV